MSTPKGDGKLSFSWGVKKGTINLYESFTLNDVKYSLFDSVLVWGDNGRTEIGKIIKILETENREKQVELVWFLRPAEIVKHLGNVKPLEKEIFLACGKGLGLSNVWPLETVYGACDVVCSSKDQRNPQPTEEQLKVAKFIFHRTFDVATQKISEEFPSSIAGIEVNNFFNRSPVASIVGSGPNAHPRAMSGKESNVPGSTSGGEQMKSSIKDRTRDGDNIKKSASFLPENSSDTHLAKKRKLQSSSGNQSDYALPNPSTIAPGEKKRVKNSCIESTDLSTRKSFLFKQSGLSGIGPDTKQQGEKKHVKTSCIENTDLSTRKSFLLKQSELPGKGPDTKQQGEKTHVKTSCIENTDLSTRKSFLLKQSELPGKGPDTKQQGEKTHVKTSCIENTDLSTRKSFLLKQSELPGKGPDTKHQGEKTHVKTSCIENTDLSTRKSFLLKQTELSGKGPDTKQQVGTIISHQYSEVTRRPGMDASKWLKLEVWEEKRLHEADEKGTLVVLENLDPSFAASEVEDIVWHVFRENVKAKMIPCTAFSSPLSGLALVIFKTKEAADKAISELMVGSLVLGDGRPIVGRRRFLRKVGAADKFVGHLKIDRTRNFRQREEWRNAVSTSHFSQGNTIEFEMAIQWRALQEKSNICWKALLEVQAKEMEALMKQMKIHCLSEN